MSTDAVSPEEALEALREQILDAAADKRALCIRGGGTKDFYGETPIGEPLDMRICRGIVDYEPTELVIRARCGTPLAEIDEALAAHGQMLAFEPPVFGATTTIGGVIAAGLSGPRRASAGAARDFVLGVSILDAQGSELRFGGQVMKNVAGYDVSRLMCGSLGILGPIVDVSLKVLPRPARETTMVMQLGQSESLQAMNRWSAEPLPISATMWRAGECCVRLSGAQPAVEAAASRFEREHGARRLDDAQSAQTWSALRDHRHAFFASTQPLWRLSLPSTAAALDLPGEALVEWAGAQRWMLTDADAQTIREACERVGGTATRFRAGDATRFRGGDATPFRAAETMRSGAADATGGVFHPLPTANASVHRRLKQAFDPLGLFNPGRMYPYL